MTPLRPRALLAGALAAGATAALARWLPRTALGRDERWQRTNFAGNPVSLLEGVALSAGLCGAAAVTPITGESPRSAAAVVVASALPGAVGAWDDLHPDAERKGLRGHLGALARGEFSTGAAKIVVLAASGLLSSLIADPATGSGAPARGAATLGHGVRHLTGAGLIAGCANLVNLFDLRPGRALKVTLAVALPLSLGERGSVTAALLAGACLAAIPADLAGRTMLGDTGANPAGAVLGLALHQRCSSAGAGFALGVVVAATLASERVSFTRVIESTPVLRDLDAWGRA